jgi:hypothetical protein
MRFGRARRFRRGIWTACAVARSQQVRSSPHGRICRLGEDGSVISAARAASHRNVGGGACYGQAPDRFGRSHFEPRRETERKSPTCSIQCRERAAPSVSVSHRKAFTGNTDPCTTSTARESGHVCKAAAPTSGRFGVKPLFRERGGRRSGIVFPCRSRLQLKYAASHVHVRAAASATCAFTRPVVPIAVAMPWRPGGKCAYSETPKSSIPVPLQRFPGSVRFPASWCSTERRAGAGNRRNTAAARAGIHKSLGATRAAQLG